MKIEMFKFHGQKIPFLNYLLNLIDRRKFSDDVSRTI